MPGAADWDRHDKVPGPADGHTAGLYERRPH
jgi:hypothetical protein